MGELIKFKPPVVNGSKSNDDYEWAHMYVCNCGHEKFLWLGDKDTGLSIGFRCADCGEYFEFANADDEDREGEQYIDFELEDDKK